MWRYSQSSHRPQSAVSRRRMSEMEEVLASSESPQVQPSARVISPAMNNNASDEVQDLEWNVTGNAVADSGEGCSEPLPRAECRMCHDEDFVDGMEAPCGCNGTLKYAHRECVQKWCSKKGSIRCEICHQNYTPGYTAPPNAAECFAIEIRQSWASHVGRNGAFDRDFEDEEDAEDSDEGRDFGPSILGISCLRIAALALMLVLFVRHIHTVMKDTNLLNDPETYLNFSGFLLPLYCMMQFLRMLYRRKVRRDRRAAAALAAVARNQRRQQE